MTIVIREEEDLFYIFTIEAKMHTTVINGNTKDVEIHNSLDSC
jgi:hypothetical protein